MYKKSVLKMYQEAVELYTITPLSLSDTNANLVLGIKWKPKYFLKLAITSCQRENIVSLTEAEIT